MIPNGKAKTIADNLDILFVIDTTISMIAEDYDNNETRLSAVKKDCEYIIEDDNLYFKWDEPNKYIVKGNKTIYFELNGIKL